MQTPDITCSACATPAAPTDWCCTRCGAPLEVTNLPPFNAEQINQSEWSLWRYAAMLPVQPHVTIGEGMTPLVDTRFNGLGFRAKLEYLNPTGSYKDRGTTALINHLKTYGVTDIVEDSSGNAGSSIAMFASLAGMRSRIFIPKGAPGAKRKQIGMVAELVEIEGPKSKIFEAVVAAANEPGIAYASHSWHPMFIVGQMTLAWEIWEQNGRRAPGAIACPVGMGCLLLGLSRGFDALYAAGLIDRVPKIFGVQAAASDPIVQAWEQDLEDIPTIEVKKTVADGIVIAKPVRSKAVLKAIRDSGGAAFRVEESAILPVRDQLAKQGLLVEPTSATTVAALPQIRKYYEGSDLVVILTGNGLKTMDVGM